MNPKKKILILSGCLLTVAAVVGGTLFVQKSSNHVLNKTSIGKFHEAEAHTATGFVVCKTEALQEVFQQKFCWQSRKCRMNPRERMRKPIKREHRK